MDISWSAKLLLAGAGALMGDRLRKRLKVKVYKCPECGSKAGIKTPIAVVCQTCGAMFKE